MPVPHTASLPAAREPFVLTLPGGVELRDLDPVRVAQPALTPLAPLFNVLDAVVAIFDCVRAVPESFGPPPDPSALVSAIADAARKVARLLGLVPQLSLPRTLLGLVDLLLGVLDELVAALRQLVDRLAVVSRAEERARELGDENLVRILGVARANVATEAAQLGARLGAASGVFGLLRILMALVGGPELPDLERPPVDDLDGFVATLEDLMSTLRSARRMIPL